MRFAVSGTDGFWGGGNGVDLDAVEIGLVDPEGDSAISGAREVDEGFETLGAFLATEAFVLDAQCGVILGGALTQQATAKEAEQGGDEDDEHREPANALEAPGALLVGQILLDLEGADLLGGLV